MRTARTTTTPRCCWSLTREEDRVLETYIIKELQQRHELVALGR